MRTRRARLSPGRQPYDPINGMRVGALVGALLGGVLLAVTGSFWFVVGGAIVGGTAGYQLEKRSMD